MGDLTKTSDSLEQLVARLQGSRDYRVLHRLKPLQAPLHAPPASRVAKLAFVDCETTGLDPKQDKVIDIGVLTVEINAQTGDLLQVLGNWNGLQDPGRPIPGHITALTGITDAMVAGQSFNEDALREELVSADLVIGHNASFDRPFLEAEFAWFERFPWACSHKLIDWQREGYGSAKLEFIAFKLGFFYDGHRALVDCHALAQALFLAKLKSTGESALSRILDTFSAPDYVVNANNAPFDAKDVLKERDYRWDGQDRIWHKTLVNGEGLQDELDWLRTTVYKHRPARVQVETRDAFVKYTARKGEIEWRSIGAQGDSGRAFGASGRRVPF